MRLRLSHLVTVSILASSPHGTAASFWSRWLGYPETKDEGPSDGAPTPANNQQKSDGDPLIKGFPDFVKWFRSNGGTIDDRITIGYEPGTNIRGMMATAPIPANTILIHTPKSLVLKPADAVDQCKDIEGTINEMKLGPQSKWHAYFEFGDSSGSRVPCQWDRANGEPGTAMRELQGLPPSGDTHRHIDWYQGTCNNGKKMTDLVDWRGLLMFLTRASDIGLVPMYSLLNHHNGFINTKLQRDDRGGLSVFALTDISANEPIYNTYARSGGVSTVSVFNNYGFVEDYPQLWRWNDEQLIQLAQENADHAHHRYGMSKHGDRSLFQPNTEHYEILIISPTLAALSPTKQLVDTLGNARRSLEQWENLITHHHANLRSSHANDIHDSALTALESLPTTIEEDEALVSDPNRRIFKLEETERGMIDVNKDAMQAIEFRLAFKKALRLAVEVAEMEEKFLADSEEL